MDKKERTAPTQTPNSPKPPQSLFRKIWWFIWEDNSVWSWLANIVLAFLIIKFLVYPTLGFALGTTHPIVAVVSGSMEHDRSFDDWWLLPGYCLGGADRTAIGDYSAYGITKEQFKGFPFRNGFNKGDLMILGRTSDLEVGDVVVFGAAGLGDPVIHRTVSLTTNTVNTKGDHNCGSAGFERDIPQDMLIGKAVLRIPYLGWIKIGFVNLINLVIGRA